MTKLHLFAKPLFLTVIVFLILYLVSGKNSLAASPQFLVSWQVENYAPAWYQGKIFPVKDTPIVVSFELIENGRLVNLSNQKIRWYINDDLVKNEDDGLGIKSIRFNIPDYRGRETTIKIVVWDYLAEALYKIVQIPVLSPEAVIDYPYPTKEINTGLSIFQVIPFFFNVQSINDLAAEWSANGEKAGEPGDNSWQLKLNIDSQTKSGTAVDLTTSINNPLQLLESATKSIHLQIK